MADANVILLAYMDTEPGALSAGARTMLQGWKYRAAEPLLDGPVSRRVAVIDTDPDTGEIVPGARFVPPRGATAGHYAIADPLAFEASDFMQVSVFTAVMRMMALFESPDVLGRPLRWAFEGEQLRVVPRAGKMPNAYYSRDSRSLHFFCVDDPRAPGRLVYSCLSPDIVAHEATHAILDGIAPDLYDATSPQSLALHEAVADLGAVMLAVRTNRLLKRVMEETSGTIRGKNAFNDIARQFGEAIYGPGRPLRDLDNAASLRPPVTLDLNEPHELSTVLTGALYALLLHEYEATQDEDLAAKLAERAAAGRPAPTEAERRALRFSLSGLALFKASETFKRIAFRALDYLPPGEISFADYGRAMVAADTASNPEDAGPRDFIRNEFAKRGMIESGTDLDPVPPGFTLPADLDLDLLVRSDLAAGQFAEQRRRELMIPPGVPFEVRPRLDVTRTTWRTGGVEATTRALLLKVAWQGTQPLRYGDDVMEVAVTRGSTLAIDWETRTVQALLSTSPDHASQQDGATARNAQMRAAFLVHNLDKGMLEPGSPNVRLEDKTLRVRALGQMLHMMPH
ncbi:MAG TPA: hypothetical protein VLA00_05515 [Xanthobacteraceae bacterium]|nr:hypothetical protein [Xanthobacteraceae bacterium]